MGKLYPPTKGLKVREFAFVKIFALLCSLNCRSILNDAYGGAISFSKKHRISIKKYYTVMSKICQITGKKAMVGNNVSHSKRRTKRTFDVNLFRKKFYWPEEDRWISLKISAAGLRLINRIGLNEALKRASDAGYLNLKK